MKETRGGSQGQNLPSRVSQKRISQGRVSPRRISPLMLERFHLGEVTAEERKLVEAELASGGELSSRYESLDESDRELRLRYPLKQTLRALPAVENYRRFRSKGRAAVLFAAALLLMVFVPTLNQLRSRWFGENPQAGGYVSGPDRLKGTEISFELSVYIEENSAQANSAALAAQASPTAEGRRLPNRALLREGNTVQLAYITPPGEPCYGVIFSIDGRSQVTLHYPYRVGQSPVLTSGKRTFLSEAYTLDDAPDFEVFFMVTSQSRLDTQAILASARALPRTPEAAIAGSAAAFSGCDVKTFTILKQK